MSKLCLLCGKPLNDESLTYHHHCSKRFFGRESILLDNFDEDKNIDANLKEKKSVSGVQKKFSFSFASNVKRKTISILNNQYIIKTESKDIKNLVVYEWVGMKLADICDIETVECGVLLNKNKKYFITKRIDRTKGSKIPMEDFCQLSNMQTEYKYNGSYEIAAKRVINTFSTFSLIDKIKYFQIIFFSYIIGNTDMHLKNFSLYKIGDVYKLTPAYDLVPVRMVFNQEEMALSLHGKKTKLTKNDFLAFAENIGVSKIIASNIIKSICLKEEEMYNFISSSELPDEEKEKFVNFLKTQINSFK